MALHLVTGYAGTEHVTSANDGALYSHIIGSGKYVFDRGNKFSAEIISNNLVRVADGEGLINGRYFEMIKGTTEDVVIENGSQSMNRNDLIVVRYAMNEDTGIETSTLTVIKGEETSDTATDPSFYDVSILDGNTIADMPLYRVVISGLSITKVERLFTVVNITLENISETLGNADISEIGDGSVKGAITSQNEDLAKTKEDISTLNSDLGGYIKKYTYTIESTIEQIFSFGETFATEPLILSMKAGQYNLGTEQNIKSVIVRKTGFTMIKTSALNYENLQLTVLIYIPN